MTPRRCIADVAAWFIGEEAHRPPSTGSRRERTHGFQWEIHAGCSICSGVKGAAPLVRPRSRRRARAASTSEVATGPRSCTERERTGTTASMRASWIGAKKSAAGKLRYPTRFGARTTICTRPSPCTSNAGMFRALSSTPSMNIQSTSFSRFWRLKNPATTSSRQPKDA